MLTANQNARELNVSMKNGIKANLDNINNVIDLSVDRTIIMLCPLLKQCQNWLIQPAIIRIDQKQQDNQCYSEAYRC